MKKHTFIYVFIRVRLILIHHQVPKTTPPGRRSYEIFSSASCHHHCHSDVDKQWKMDGRLQLIVTKACLGFGASKKHILDPLITISSWWKSSHLLSLPYMRGLVGNWTHGWTVNGSKQSAYIWTIHTPKLYMWLSVVKLLSPLLQKCTCDVNMNAGVQTNVKC